jgi:hypothetical protein
MSRFSPSDRIIAVGSNRQNTIRIGEPQMSTKQVFATLTVFAVITLLALSVASALGTDVFHQQALSRVGDEPAASPAISEATARYARFYGAPQGHAMTSPRRAATTDATSQYAEAYGGQARKTADASDSIADATRRYAAFYDSAAIAVQRAATK